MPEIKNSKMLKIKKNAQDEFHNNSKEDQKFLKYKYFKI